MSHPHPRLSQPPRLPRDGLRIVALGGIGEIGRNMTVLEHQGQLLIIDCGVLFPEAEQPGVDLILPDFTWIRDRLHKVQAVVLTHGHEDHIGALPYLLREREDIPIVGSRFTLALLEAKLVEHRLRPLSLQVKEGGREQLGVFDCEFLAVNHSIPDALAVAVRTSAGLLLHTGDFKMDQTPLDGRLTDLNGFARLGAEGVDLLLSDSTNADVPGFVTSESSIGPVLHDVVQRAKGRVVVACFASHVHRVQQVINAAVAADRNVAFVGRSMVRNMGVAKDLGLLEVPDGLLVDARKIDDLPESRVMLVSTGSQGEPLSALSRMANGDHPVKITEADTVVLASSLIPGNETSIFRVINGLSRLGATVVHKGGGAMVHVSGHSAAGELLYVLNAVRPSNFMPVHGEWRHLRAHAALGARSGVPAERIMLAEDGVVVDLVDGQASITGAVPCGYVYVDGQSVGDVREAVIKDRLILGEEGFVTITVVLDAVTGKVTGGPDVSARGVSDTPGAFDPVVGLTRDALERAVAEGMTDAQELSRLVRRVVGRWVSDTFRRKPMILPVVVEV